MLFDQIIWPKSSIRAACAGRSLLTDDAVLIAAIDLADAASDYAANEKAAISLLDHYELSRAQAFRHDVDRVHYIAAHGALRRILAAVLDGNPQDIGFGRGKHGKPFIEQGVKIPGHFNLSHTNEVAVVAICTTAEVGIDVETIRTIPDAAALAALQFSAGENSTLARLPDHEKMVGFYHCWTQREAVLKLFGWGLVAAPSGIEIEADPHIAPCVRALPSPEIPPRLFALPGISRHLGCVAVPHEVNRMICLRW